MMNPDGRAIFGHQSQERFPYIQGHLVVGVSSDFDDPALEELLVHLIEFVVTPHRYYPSRCVGRTLKKIYPHQCKMSTAGFPGFFIVFS
jgi:hypothetical protein